MYGYIYLTTNLINNKKYIGQHKATKFSQKYLGSGTLIRQAIRKYGKSSFSVELLCECDSPQEMSDKEKYYIHLYNAVQDESFYNIEQGGSFYDSSCYERMQQSAKNRKSNNEGNRCMYRGDEYIRVPANQVDAYLQDGWSFGGRKHSNESKQNHSHARDDRLLYTNGSVTKYIKQDEVDFYKSQGFYPGRVPSVKKGTVKYAWVNDGNKNVYIKFEQLEEYLKNGYNRGMLKGNRTYNKSIDKPVHNKGKVQVRKDGKIKHISKDDLQKYIDDGYEKVKKD